MYKKKALNHFASSGGIFLPVKKIIGKVENETIFVSNEFTGSITDDDFWVKLRAYAKSINSYVMLLY